MPSSITLTGHVFNDSGAALQDVAVSAFARNTVSSALATDTSDSNGRFDLAYVPGSTGASANPDVQGTSGASVFRWKFDDAVVVQRMVARDLRFKPDNDFDVLFTATPTAERTVTFPDNTGTVAEINLAQTFSAIQTHSADIIVQDASDVALGTGSDTLLRWSTGDADNHATVLALANANQNLHIADVGGIATDWAQSANTTGPAVFMHSDTTPATNYTKMAVADNGAFTVSTVDADGTAGDYTLDIDGEIVIDAADAAGVIFKIDGTAEAKVTANGIEAENAAGPALVNEAATTTNPTLVPDKAELDTGIGWASDTLHFVLGGTTHANLTTSAFTVSGGLVVGGDLTVSGTTTTVVSTTVAIADSMLLLAKDQGTSADAVDFGIYGKYGVGGTAKYAGIFRDLSATNDPWTFFDTLEAEPGTTVNTGGTGYALAAITAAEIVGTTIDASTDFTIGNTVTTDGVVTDSSGLSIAAAVDLGSNTLTTTGLISGGSLDIDNVLINGTTIGHTDDTDLLTLADGALTTLGTITVGVDDTGHDVKFFGATTGTYMLWDENTDDLVLTLGAELYFYDAAGGEHIKSDGTDMTIYAGTDLNLTVGADVNIATDKGLTFGDDGQKIESDGTDFTIASGAKLNLTPTSDVHIANGTGMVIGHTAQIAIGGATHEFQVLGTASATDAGAGHGIWGNNSDGFEFHFGKSRAAAIGGSAVTVNNGDTIAQLIFDGDDGADMATRVASLAIDVDGTVASNQLPGRFIFRTANSSGSNTEALRIDSAQEITLANLPTGAVANIGHASNVLTIESSSREYKRDEQSARNTDRIYNLEPKDFVWDENSATAGLAETGLIAEDVYAVIPEAVVVYKDRVPKMTTNASTGEETGEYVETGEAKPQAIRMPVLMAMVIDQMKQLKASVDKLEAA